MPSITQFVKTILETIDFKPVEILVTIDTKFYPNDFGINVKPLLFIIFYIDGFVNLYIILSINAHKMHKSTSYLNELISVFR